VKANLADPRTAALTSFLLALPFTSLILMLMLGIEPGFGSLDPLLRAPGSRLGSYIVFGALLLLLGGLAISGVTVVRSVQAGKGLMTDPVNLLLATGILLVLLLFAGAIVVDQYPCWIGVPNCD
jgi:hypothetical protein